MQTTTSAKIRAAFHNPILQVGDEMVIEGLELISLKKTLKLQLTAE